MDGFMRSKMYSCNSSDRNGAEWRPGFRDREWQAALFERSRGVVRNESSMLSKLLDWSDRRGSKSDDWRRVTNGQRMLADKSRAQARDPRKGTRRLWLHGKISPDRRLALSGGRVRDWQGSKGMGTT